MHKRNVTPETPTTDRFVPSVIEREACKRHGAEKGDPCGHLGPNAVICNARAKRAGFNGKISEKSIRMTRQKR